MTEKKDGGLGEELERRVSESASGSLSVCYLADALALEARLPGKAKAVFTTRLSRGPRGSERIFDLSVRSSPFGEVAVRNRRRLARVLERPLISPNQVHGVRVVGLAEYASEPEESPCDGLTLHPEIDQGLAAALLFADCVPVVMCGDTDMAVVHAGWRGLLQGVVQQAARAMMSPPGMAVIGPSIGPCCFEVSAEIATAFAARYGPGVVMAQESRFRVDLWAAAVEALAEVEVSAQMTVNPRLCTACNSDLFFSYRREGPRAGRHACVAWMEEL